jgi:putative nucleotidyltransferase with HDIG domain
LGRLFVEASSVESFRAGINAEFPAAFSPEILTILYNESDRERVPEYGRAVLEYLLDEGVFALPPEGLEVYNRDMAELRHTYGQRTEREQIRYDRVITLGNIDDTIDRYVTENSLSASFAIIAPSILTPFIAENVFFSPGDTNQQITEIRDRVEPVIKYIERGKKVIRKGFLITDDDAAQLRALSISYRQGDPRGITGQILVMFLLYGLMVFLAGPRSIGRLLKPEEVYLFCALAAGYLIMAVLIRNFANIGDLPPALFLPTALVVMLPAILVGPRPALAVAVVLPLVAFLAGALDSSSYVFALTSGVAAAYTLRGVERRIDLVKTGLIIGAANCIAAVTVLLMNRVSIGSYPLVLFGAALNGLISGMLVLGFLPMLEHALNSVTTFRLIELSDLNTPILKRLFSVAPGTYSHSLMVATLAETACQEIGANPLIARVGAYYHDSGKMENPDYCVENQTAYNKHGDINPRLSATIIRSHVKLGVEKGRALGLPKEVVDIIAEHHGNSVISYFYNAALKRESSDVHSKSAVNMEDFTYPGTPPHSKESAVVMLADVTEAAVRTLKKPTASRLEKFIQELIMAKFQHGQLSESELTFRDLETIKNAFIRVLAGHYHTRIEYPKAPKEPVPAAFSEEGPAPSRGRHTGGHAAAAASHAPPVGGHL